jgi:hypothetical protein
MAKMASSISASMYQWRNNGNEIISIMAMAKIINQYQWRGIISINNNNKP